MGFEQEKNLKRGTGYRVWGPNNRNIQYAEVRAGGDGNKRSSPALDYSTALIWDTQFRDEFEEQGLDPRLISMEFLGGNVWIVDSTTA